MAEELREERIGVGDAKSHFSELLERVRDESLIVTITRHGRPVARLVPVDMVSAPGHLADAAGWLNGDEEFFADVERLVAARSKHRPRAAKLGG